MEWSHSGGEKGEARKCLVVLVCLIAISGCMRYLSYEREDVLIENVDIDQTLKVAKDELEEGGWGSVLTLWAIRDQVLTPQQAERISALYFDYIGTLRRRFNRWHLTWAISNMYRHGSRDVKQELRRAYDDATRRAETISATADTHANGDKLYMGDIHIGGRRYAKKHVVVPGNKNYIDSYEEYKQNN
jgi:hypothetical protein